MKAIDVVKQIDILSNPLKIKKVIFNNGGVYDDCHNWISLTSGKIAGVVKLKNGACSVLFKTECQSINIVDFDDDNINLQVSNYSIGQNYFGPLDKQNVDRYNDYVAYDSNRIEKFTIIRNNSINIEDLDTEIVENFEKQYRLLDDKNEEVLIVRYDFDSLTLRDDIERALSTLTDRESTVLRMRFGFDDGVPMTLQEVAKELDRCAPRIRQIEQKALHKLRNSRRSGSIKWYLL